MTLEHKRQKRFTSVKRIGALIFVTALAVTLVVNMCFSPPATQPVRAVFPGANGKIAFVSDRDGNDEIYVMTATGSGVTRLTNNAAVDISPRWSPDGKKIVFASDRDGNY